ncbi:LPS-assembly protein LptD [Nitrosophilus labii]|uniref:LPS-assembly protein LptD n=1 Tax=Nitrosophilus labii TaxID=2706014 RepID=UPI0016573568|nr:LPS assembly protein LptD [Nitrosophilus labii]
MYKVLCFFLFCVLAYSKELPLELFAKKVETRQDIVVAKEDVVLVYDGYYIEADKALYDKNSSTIELFGKISILKESSYTILSEYAIFDMVNKKIYSKPFFFIEQKDGLWISSCEAKGKEGLFRFEDSLVSSCNPTDPDWKLEFSLGKYYEKKRWVNLYNVRLYAGEIPIFYLPYFGFSTSKERKSGLLIPKFALSNEEGFVYIQPIFIAPYPQWDLEILPQIRTKRGKGLYATFRFVDMPYSNGYFKTGFFKEKSSYVEQENLKNSTHNGFEFFYTRNALFTKNTTVDKRDGLYIDLKYLNDIDYLNLQHRNIEKSYKSLITSRVNYYYNMYNHYMGFYSKYFIDTTKVTNEDTLQIFPKLQYHSYVKSLIFNNVLYSIDYKYNNYYRDVGVNAQQYELNIPIGVYFSFFDDFLGFSVTENIYMTYIDYFNTPYWIENAYIVRNYHKFSLYSDLIKGYENFLHTIHLNASLVVPSYEKDEGQKEDFITINSETKRLEVSLKEYFYDKNGKEFLYHRIIQPIFYDSDYKYGDLENEIGFKINSKISIVSDFFYSHQYSSVNSITTSLNYKDAMQSAIVSHFYKNGFEGKEDSSFITVRLQRNLSKKYKLFGKIDYDFVNNYMKNWEFGWYYKKKCWNYKISYREDIRPILTSVGSSSIKNRAILFKVELVPLGGVEYAYRQRNEITN